MGANSEQVAWLLSLSSQTVSSSVTVGDDESTELADLFESELPTPEDFLEVSLSADYAQHLLANCTSQEREVISLRFGLDDDTPLPWSEVGKRMGLSRERVRQIQYLALERIRKRAKN